MIEMYLLLIFMIIGAIIAVETRDLLSSVVSVGAVGVGLSIIFLFLRAPDIAITQLVVEVVLLVVLIRATISRDIYTINGHRAWFGLIVSVFLVVVILVFGGLALRDLPEFGRPIIESSQNAPSNRYIESGLKDTGAANIVTSVILDYRAYDTLGEATVLFTAAIGALTVLRRRALKEKEEKVGEEE